MHIGAGYEDARTHVHDRIDLVDDEMVRGQRTALEDDFQAATRLVELFLVVPPRSHSSRRLMPRYPVLDYVAAVSVAFLCVV